MERADPHIQGQKIQSYSYCSTGKEIEKLQGELPENEFLSQVFKNGTYQKEINMFQYNFA